MIALGIGWILVILVRLMLGRRVRRACRGQCIYVANHSSHMDTVLILAMLPAPERRHTRPVASEEYWTAGPVRRFLIHSIFQGVLIERERLQMNPLEPVANALRQGDSLIFFPEGTRGTGRILQPLKPGIFHLARWFPEIDIVPVWIDYSRLPRWSIEFGGPLRWSEGQQPQEFLAEVRDALERLR